jgi:hypothetical protein
MWHVDQQWTEALPLVLLGIRSAFKEDLQASVAELVYGEPLRITGELLTPTAEPVDPVHLITELRQHMARLRPVPAARHASPATVVQSPREMHPRLPPSGHNATDFGTPLQRPLPESVRGRSATVSADRVKPAYVINGNDRGNNFNPPAATTAAAAP